jgi:hypothetical protein
MFPLNENIMYPLDGYMKKYIALQLRMGVHSIGNHAQGKTQRGGQ